MDIFSHGLWSSTIAAGSNKFKQTKLSPWLAAFWGIFPDIFAFGVPMVLLVVGILGGSVDPSLLRSARSEEPPTVFQSHNPLSNLAPRLYDISHSLVIFALVFGVVMLVKKFLLKKPSWRQCIPWEMLAWALHILCDIPTHTPRFYPTPIFWPISDWKFRYGFSWGQWWFLALDYGLLLITLIVIRVRKVKALEKNTNNFDGL